ncbi:DUF3727 domain-containing protein [Kamptonema animale CS-326]|jgi:uncharacterized protein YrzB (UPF0473 family)|uniref:DUF3727 domain-containing protein n=1 Tax=Kamptonema TaxID=1501433 RepID=UPI0001DAD26A|nr:MULTISPECIES: DUF3727 domain-containing protein [Kamptonema]MDB9513797.1 DUF3727 domain-containing protein [Kamptonema animale CS-326]CBN58275.1 conserved hypothetical protein [Kamptonema sp. PCC 6506]
MFSSPSSKRNGHSDEDSVTLTDEAGRSLTCSIEHSMDVEGQEYVLLLPVDSPVEIFTWQGDDADEAAIPVEDEAEISLIFDTAEAVLQEHNLKLLRTAVTLTVVGELPEFSEEDAPEDSESEDESDFEELMWLASFYHEEQEYAIYTPLDPFFILARMNEAGKPELLSAEEFEKLEPLLPMLEDQFFDELE